MTLYEMTDQNFDNYQEFIMDNGHPWEVTITNGDSLLEAAENSYLLEEFIQSPKFIA